MFFWIEMREMIWRYKLVADTFLAAPCLGSSSRDLDIRHPDPKDVWKQCIFKNSNLDYSFGQRFSTFLMLWLLNTVPHIVQRPTIKLFSLICITVILLLLWIVMQISDMQIVLKGLFNPQRELNTQVNNNCFRTSTFSVGLSGTLCSPSHSPYLARHDWKSCGSALAYGLRCSKGLHTNLTSFLGKDSRDGPVRVQRPFIAPTCAPSECSSLCRYYLIKPVHFMLSYADWQR